MKRVVIDTSVYVDWFRARAHEEVIGGAHGSPVLSAVVAMELEAGARAHERLARWIDSFRRRERLLVPDAQVYALSGRVLRALRGEGIQPRDIVGDVLIAMSARVVGARVITINRTDFERIRAVEPFELMVL